MGWLWHCRDRTAAGSFFAKALLSTRGGTIVGRVSDLG